MSPLKASEAQLFYATVLNRLTIFGFALLLVAFLIYITGLLDSYVPLEQVPQYWGRSCHDFLEAVKIQPGWYWGGKNRLRGFSCLCPHRHLGRRYHCLLCGGYF